MGYKKRSDTKPLDWAGLHEDGHRFQAMALALFGDKYEDGFAPGPLHRGPDGGWDGQYDGRLERITGKWKVACAVRKDRKALRKKVIEENRKAVRDKADALLVMTSLDLKNPEIAELEVLASKGLKKGKLWAQSKLDRMVSGNPWVASTYFDLQFVAGFEPPGAADVLISGQEDLALVGREAEVSTVAAFLDGEASVLIISGPGGSGKSRLMRQIQALASRAKGRLKPSVWVRRSRAGTIEDALASALPKKRPLILCLDDAGQDLDDVLSLVRLAEQEKGNIDVKVVLVSRSADIHQVEATCRKSPATTLRIPLSRIGDEAAHEIARCDGPRLDEQTIDRLVQVLGGNLYLLRATTALVNAGKSSGLVLDDGGVRAVLADRFFEESESALSSTMTSVEARQEILQAALRTPIPISECQEGTSLRILQREGLLRRVGNRVRFRTDVEGDLVLRELMGQSWALVSVESYLGKSVDSKRGIAIRNLAAAGGAESERLLRNICLNWVEEARTTEYDMRLGRLKLAPYLAMYAPDIATDLCRRYLYTPAPPSQHPWAEFLADVALSMDDFGPVLHAIGQNGPIDDSLELYREALETLPSARFSNYQPTGFVADLLSPLTAHSSKIEDGIAWFHASLERSSGQARTAELVAAGLACLLSPAVHWKSTFGMEMTFHEQSLNPTDAVLKWRDSALALLETGLCCQHKEIRFVCARVASRLKVAHLGRASVKQMKPRLREEISKVLPWVQARLFVENDIKTLRELHKGLVRRWATQNAAGEEAGKIVLAFERPILLKAYELAEQPWNWIPDLKQRMSESPQKDRWRWWCEQTRIGVDLVAADSLIADLRKAFPGVDGLLEIAETVLGCKNSGFFFDRLFLVDPEAFADIATLKEDSSAAELLRKMHEQQEVRNSGRVAFARIKELAAVGDTKGMERIAGFISNLPILQISDVVTFLVRAEPLHSRHLGLWLLKYRGDIQSSDLVEWLQSALRDGDWSDHWETIWDCCHDTVIVQPNHSNAATEDIISAAILRSIESEKGRWRISWWYLAELVFEIEKVTPGFTKRLAVATLKPEHVYSLAHFFCPLVSDSERIEEFVDICAVLLDRGQLASAYEVADLIEATLIECSDDNRFESLGLPMEALASAEEQLASESEARRKVGLALLSEMRHRPIACVKVAELASGDSVLAAEAKELIFRFARVRGVITGGGPGVAPPAVMAVERTLMEAETQTTGPARVLVSEFLSRARSEIESYIASDAEARHPR